MPKKKKKAKKAARSAPRKKKMTRRSPKKPAKKKTAANRKKAARPAKTAKTAKTAAKAEAAAIQGTLIGKVTHYFPHVQAAVVKIEKGGIRKGDSLYFKGHTTDFKQAVTSIQIDRAAVESAGVGEEVGIEVQDRVREDDRVYKLKG